MRLEEDMQGILTGNNNRNVRDSARFHLPGGLDNVITVGATTNTANEQSHTLTTIWGMW